MEEKIPVYRINSNDYFESYDGTELNIEYIDVTNENEILKDLVYRYCSDYVVIKGDEYTYRRKQFGFNHYEKCSKDEIFEAVLEAIAIMGIAISWDGMLRCRQKSINLYVLNEDELPKYDWLNIIKINKEEEIIDLEYNMQHDHSNLFLYRNENDKFILRNVEKSFDDIEIYNDIPINLLVENNFLKCNY